MSLTNRAYELIKNEIITCTLEPGQQVVQSQLAERLGVGMTPVREALQRLTHEGFAQPVPRLGYIISPITLADVSEIFELRGILECGTVRLAAERGSEAQIQRLQEVAQFTYVYRDRLSYTEFLRRNADFHQSVAALSGNQRLVEAVSRVLGELLRVFHLGLDLRDSAEEMRDEHLALSAALAARDPDRAEQVIRDQILRSQHRVIEALMNRTLGNMPNGHGRSLRISPAELKTGD